MFNKKAMELPVNLVVMIIIGMVIFGLGMGLFSKFFESGEKQLDDLSSQVKTDLASLECDGDKWLCAPTYKLKNTKSEVFEIFIANQGVSNTFSVTFNLDTIDGSLKGIEKSECGAVLVSYYQGDTSIEAGNSASIPFQVLASRVSKTPCSFVTTATLTCGAGCTGNGQEVPIIVRVE